MTETPKSEKLSSFSDKVTKDNIRPLWDVLSTLVTPEPKSRCEAALWKYNEVRPLLMEAGGLLTAKEAERRVLILENPGIPGESKITTSLYAGIQLVLPGEIAPAHKHSQSAFRFVLEGGDGAYTAVNGEKAYMEVGDLILTPSGTWHDHGNESDNPVIWLDGLDIPIVQFFDASFMEHHTEDEHPHVKSDGDSLARYGSGMLPMDYEAEMPTSPVIKYPYSRTKQILNKMKETKDWDPCHGLKLMYVNPSDGKSAMPTLGAYMQLLPAGFITSSYRSTDATIYSVVEGNGKTKIGDKILEWGPKDTFVVPSWHHHQHIADSECVLFSFSDRPVQKALGLWREDRGNR
ncbi:MAG: gentisate 1,2-dioxygenase [Alphaproteobacteria bacterium]|nr:gentisate 1,2-dioxygenase [Alphaproteobacteria bacterium]HPF47713.1 gentisate 1,2-dioxygenase [Emcibacteraceae bacterium]HRW30803.1 gentisate 1,2-dioxygenase [Emcibacteraceae bacterium]